MSSLMVTGVRERDIELLLLEELISTPSFANWLLSRIGLKNPPPCHSVQLSSDSSTGKAFIEMEIVGDARLARIVVVFEMDEGYSFTGGRPTGTVDADDSEESPITVLVAARNRIARDEGTVGHNRFISLEEVSQWYTQTSELGQRAVYKRALLRSAIERTSTLHHVLSGNAWRFNRAYWEVAQRLHPELRMTSRLGKQHTPGCIYFWPKGMPQGMTLVHRVLHGRVEMDFTGLGVGTEELVGLYDHFLEAGMRIIDKGTSGVVSLRVCPMEMGMPIDEDTLVEAMAAATRLWEWFRRIGHIRPSAT